jgi:hypothetical protein
VSVVPDRFEAEGLRLLAAGRPRALVDVIDASGRDDLIAHLLRADAMVRQMDIDLAEVQALVERVHDEVPPTGDARTGRLRAWASALLAERLATDGEVISLAVARSALDEIAEVDLPVLPPMALRYARARLTRVESGAWLMVPSPDGLAEHRTRRDQAIAELLSLGFVEEVHATRGAMAGLMATALYEDIAENHHRLVDARTALGDEHDSMWSPVLDYLLGISSFEMCDMGGALLAFDRIEGSRFRHRRLGVLPRYGRAFFRLVTAGASPTTIAGIEAALAEVRRHDPRVAQHWYGQVTHTLADMGRPAAAAHFARLEGELPAIPVMGRVDRRILQLRVAAVNGQPVATDEVVRSVEAIAGFGHRRRAARAAVRLGHDLAAGGDPDGARTVHQWGLERLPPRRELTLWEAWWARSVGEPGEPARSPGATAAGRVSSPRGPGGPRVEVRVLAPTVEVEVQGRPVEVSEAQAKLLLALAVAHPAPLHIERASDVLWPDEELAATRSRLNSLVHRLRRVIEPHGEAIGRSGDLLLLDESQVRVDLWWFQRALAGDPGERRKALLSVRGNLGDAQFPYDEGFFDERHRLSGEWMRHACRAHKVGEVAITDLEPALASLKLTSADLDMSLA